MLGELRLSVSAQLRIFPGEVEVSHFATRFGFVFAVEVDFEAGVAGEGGGPVGLAFGPDVAEEVDHGTGTVDGVSAAEGEAADGADVLLELVGAAGVDGDVARVMRTRGQLVHQQTVACLLGVVDDKHFDGEGADDVESSGDVEGHFACRFA